MPLPASFLPRLGAGLALPLRAAAWLSRRPATWRYALVPVALTVAGLAVGLAAGIPLSGTLLSLVWSEPAGFLAAFWHAARVAIVLVELYTLAVVLPIVLSGPFMDALSARVEAEELGATETAGGVRRVLAETTTGLVHSLGRVALYYLGLLLLLPALLVPVLWPPLVFLWTARWTAVEWAGLPMARNLHGFGETRAVLRAVRPTGFGMGLSLAALFVVPLANFLVVPVGAVAGTLLYCELARDGVVRRAIPAPPPASPGSR